MESKFNIRPATIVDSEFLAEAIIMADKGIGEICSYCGVFNLSYREVFSFIKSMVEEELEGCEISTEHFLIAEKDGVAAAAVSSWVEAADGVSSWMIRSALLQEYFPLQALEYAKSIDKIVKDIVVGRTKGTLQMESIYVRKQFRGNKLAQILISEQAKKHSNIEIAELMAYSGNIPAIEMYKKIGFNIVVKKISDNPEILNYYPANGMMSMQIPVSLLIK